jgi:uncharacterized membrane protein (DUF485 family)
VTLRQKAAVLLVSSSTLITMIVIGLFLGAELMAFLSTKTVTTVVIMRWLRVGLGVLYVGAVVAVIGVLIARPRSDEEKADKDKGPAQ